MHDCRHFFDGSSRWVPGGTPRVVLGFTIRHGKIVAINLLPDSERVRQLDLTVPDD